MPGLPADLAPLPTAPYERRPVELPLDREECRTAIWRTSGNLTRAAEILKVSSARLRKFVESSPYLKDEVSEAREQLVDTAEDVVRDALRDPERADTMARFVLQSQGKSRGWGAGSTNVKIGDVSGNITIQWADGSTLVSNDPVGDAQKVIDHE